MVVERHELSVVKDGKHWGDGSHLRMARLLPGRVLVEVERDKEASATLWTPELAQWSQDNTFLGKRPHFGRVLAMGPPARTPVRRDGSGGAEVAYGFGVGERVLFVYGVALEKVRSFAGNLAIVAQEEVQAVVYD
jgi:hypothetical protein